MRVGACKWAKCASASRLAYNRDINTGAVDSRTILNETILNEDIANGTINLKTKVTDTLEVQNGGTGLGSVAADNILMGNGTNKLEPLPIADSVMVFSNNSGKGELYKLRAGYRASMEIDETDKTVYIHAVDQSGGPDKAGHSIAFGIIQNGKQMVRQFEEPSVQMGDIVLVTADVDLQELTMTSYVQQNGWVTVVMYNGRSDGADVDLGTITIKIANFGQ